MHHDEEDQLPDEDSLSSLTEDEDDCTAEDDVTHADNGDNNEDNQNQYAEDIVDEGEFSDHHFDDYGNEEDAWSADIELPNPGGESSNKVRLLPLLILMLIAYSYCH